MNRFAPHLTLASLIALFGAGCAAAGDGAHRGDGGDGTEEDAGGGCTRTLEFVTGRTQNLAPGGATVDLRVRLEGCQGELVAGDAVRFEIKGTAGGATLSALSAQTDGDGEAGVTLTSGATGATFTVEASATDAAPIAFQIKVGSFTTGSINVTLTYRGALRFDQFQTFLHDGVQCSRIAPFNLPAPALASSAPQPTINGRPEYKDLAPATDYAVIALAKVGPKTLGYACVDRITVRAGNVTQTTVAIQDIPITFIGTYQLDNRFDLTGSLPPSVATAVTIFNELTNDKGEPNVGGNPACDPAAPAPRYCGTDPAAFILDVVYRQICHWECNAGETFSTCSEKNHPTGDLSALYTQNFMNWAGAIPRSFGLCGSLEVIHPTVEPILDRQINQYVPSLALKILNIAGDLARAIQEMHITSELEIGRRGDTELTETYRHTLKDMIVEVHDFSDPPKLLTRTFALSAAGLTSLTQNGNVTSQGDLLTIPSHQFQLDFGKLLFYIYSAVILPAVSPPGQHWTKTEDLLNYVVNCNRCNPPAGAQPGLGCTLYNNIGLLTDVDYENFCHAGLAAAGLIIDARLMALVSGSTLITLDGTGHADMVNNMQVADAIKQGVWNGKWEEGARSDNFPGTFTGKR